MRRTARGIYLGMAKNNMSHRIDNIIDGVEVRQAELLLNEETLIDIRVERMAEEMRNITQIHDTDDTPLTA